MALTINTNLMAANSARSLNSHYNKLATSTQRLSSGLRVNSAADDAAGLAVREMMRSDIATLGQGIRNANDAISMIQTADGALGVIDEKLIRMKELAEQASTGTYNSVQRMIIDSEFQAMASEITRIAKSTTFNGIHLLDGTLAGDHDGSKVQATGKAKIHFGTGNDSAEDYYYVEIPDSTFPGLLGFREISTLTFEPISAAFDNTAGGDTEATQAILLTDGNVMIMQSAAARPGGGGGRGWGRSVSIFDPSGRRIQGPTVVPEVGGLGFNTIDSNDIAAMPGGGAASLQFEWGNATGENNSLALTILDNNLNVTGSIDLGKLVPPDSDTDRTRTGASVATNGTDVAASWSRVDGNSVVSFVDTATLPLTAASATNITIPDSLGVDVESIGGNFLVTWFDRTSNPAPPGALTMGNQHSRLYDSAGNPIGAEQDLGPRVHTTTITLDANRLAKTWVEPDPGGGGNVTMMGVWTVDAATGVVTPGTPQVIGGTPPDGRTQLYPNLTQLYNPDGTPSDDVLVTWLDKDNATGVKDLYSRRITIAGNTVVPPTSPSLLVNRGTGSGMANYVPSPVGTRDGNFIINWQNDSGMGDWAGDRNAVRVYSTRIARTVVGREGRDSLSVETQQKAQEALGVLDDAIVIKDNIRAHLGALQNRFENTITNLQTQAENLQASESRISDTDVATEMTYFVRQQILTQGAIAMLSQANSLPKMAMNIIGG